MQYRYGNSDNVLFYILRSAFGNFLENNHYYFPYNKWHKKHDAVKALALSLNDMIWPNPVLSKSIQRLQYACWIFCIVLQCFETKHLFLLNYAAKFGHRLCCITLRCCLRLAYVFVGHFQSSFRSRSCITSAWRTILTVVLSS